MNAPKSLAVLLTEPLTLHLLPTDVGSSVLLEGRTFVDSGLGDWIGFYDWLRTSQGELLGVRTWLTDPQVQGIRGELSNNSAVELGDADVRVWFSEERSFDEAASGDQDLGTHRIMKFGEGEFALTFNIERLSESELQTLIERVSWMHGERV
jgi:hypothetical protein